MAVKCERTSVVFSTRESDDTVAVKCERLICGFS